MHIISKKKTSLLFAWCQYYIVYTFHGEVAPV